VPAVNSLSLVYLPQNFAFAPPSGVRRQKTDAFSHLLGCPAAVSTGPSSRRSLGPFSCQGIAVCPRIRLCLRGQYFTTSSFSCQEQILCFCETHFLPGCLTFILFRQRGKILHPRCHFVKGVFVN